MRKIVLVICIGGGLFDGEMVTDVMVVCQACGMLVVLPRLVSAGLWSTEKCAVGMTIGRCLDGRFWYKP